MTKTSIWKSDPHGNLQFLVLELDGKSASLASTSKLIPQGVYTTLRTYYGDKILPLGDQIKRLEGSASLVGVPISLDESRLKEMIRCAISEGPAVDYRLRLTVDLQVEPGTLYLTLEPLQVPSAEDYAEGVYAVTISAHRDNPRAKQTSFLSMAEKIQEGLPPGANEALMVDENGTVLEGLSSNFFGFLNGQLQTAGVGILPGLTRAFVIEAAQREKIPIYYEGISVDRLPELHEAFISSSSRSILPVRQIDQYIIGQGLPGQNTSRLREIFWEILRSRLIDIAD